MSRKLFIYASLFLVLMLTMPVDASTWQVFNESSGLCGRIVNCYASFKTVMAVGTDQGVSIYSGDTGSWSTLKLPDEVASTPVKDIAFDEHGHLWLATGRGLVNVQEKTVNVYDASHKIPTVDIDRVQVNGEHIFIGCFGGYVARAFVPQTGFTSFVPVNYDDGPDAGGFKIKSVGVSGLAMTDANRGWISTRGGGLIEIMGASNFLANSVDGDPESWINDFFMYEGKSREMNTLAVTPTHLSLIRNNNTQQEYKLPVEDPWLNCVVAVKEPGAIFDLLELPVMKDEEANLFAFLMNRSLFIGTRNNGLWRFQRGIWTQYLSVNSSLPSDCINRLYIVGRLLVVCTDAGLVLIHLDSHYHDEFQKIGLGNKYVKTIYPFPPLYAAMIPFFQIVKGNSYWFSHLHGITRWKSGGFPKNYVEQGSPGNSSRIERPSEETEADSAIDSGEPEFPVDAVQEEALRGYWQLFTREYLFHDAPDTATDLYPIPIQKVTCITADKNSDYLWVIFEGNRLARMRMNKRVAIRNGKTQKIETPDWQMLDKHVPWASGTKLNVVWYSQEKIYVGTAGDGFYILKNPASENMKKDPFQWKNYTIYNGLPNSDVRGFTQWNSAQGKILVIRHDDCISSWDGEFFSKIEMGGRRQYTCMDSGPEGNLWIGSSGGLFRLNPEGTVFSYTTTNAWFESNKITAVGAMPLNTGTPLGVWVACDQMAEDFWLNPLANGSDQPPNVYTNPDGTKRVEELVIAGSSLHFFDGLTWDKWLMAGIRNIFIDREYIWTTSNIRVRRLLVPR